MYIDVNKAEKDFSYLIDLLTNKKINLVNICKDGIPVVQMTLVNNNINRVGAAKEKWKHISLKELNSIDISKDFDK